MKTLAQITEILESTDDTTLVALWNDYQSDINGESAVYDFDDQFFEDFFTSPSEAARAVFFGDIDGWNAKYVQFNGYGNLEASNYLDRLISISDLANHMEDKQDEYDILAGEDED